MPNGADKSYGIQVARLAGLPKEILDSPKEILAHLESSSRADVKTIPRSLRGYVWRLRPRDAVGKLRDQWPAPKHSIMQRADSLR